MRARSSIRHDNVQPHALPAESSASQRIVTAARRHFFANGFRGVTMDDLAEELGMSKKTLYACFPSKPALVEAVLLDKFRSVEADLNGITSKCSSDVLAALHQLLATVMMGTRGSDALPRGDALAPTLRRVRSTLEFEPALRADLLHVPPPSYRQMPKDRRRNCPVPAVPLWRDRSH